MPILISKTNHDINIDDVILHAKHNAKIPMIKLYREFTGKGLKDSKDACESVCNVTNDMYKHAQGYVDLFLSESKFKNIDIEQFKHMVCDAIDQFDTMQFPDYCVGLQTLAENLIKKGGMRNLIVETESFMKGLVGDA